MKKLLIFMLVLGLASAANATLSWSITGNSGPGSFDVLPSDTIIATLSLGAAETSTGISIGYIGDGAVGGTMTNSLPHADYINSRQEGMTRDEAILAGFPDAASYCDGDAIYITGATGVGNPVTGTAEAPLILWYTVDSGAMAGSTVTISAHPGFGGSSNQVDVGAGKETVPDLGLNVIPEPMTIALLGLGGLFLRRRR